MLSPSTSIDPARPLLRALPWTALAGWLLLARLSHQPPHGLVWWLLALLAAQWILTLLATSLTPRHATSPWIVWGIVFRLAGLLSLPILEDDHFRFLWDGRMFALHGNPYTSEPAAHFADRSTPTAFADILDEINNPDVPTIYGPLLQAGFLLAYLLAPAALWPWKLLLLTADITLLFCLRRLAPDPLTGHRAVAFAAFCPLSIFETAFNAHPDGLAVSLMTAALVARHCGRHTWTGICSAAALCAKLFALPLIPFLLWRARPAAWIGFSATILVCYTPFWLQGSGADLPALRAFTSQWEFNSSGYTLLAALATPNTARPLCAFLFVAAWTTLFISHVRRPLASDRHPPGLLLFGILLLLSPTFNPWYALWILPFVALQPAPVGIATLAAVSLSYLTQQNLGQATLDGYRHPAWVRPVEFGLIAAAPAVEWIRRQYITPMKCIRQSA